MTREMAILGATEGAGASTVAAGLAWLRRPTVLVDCDTSRPELDGFFPAEGEERGGDFFSERLPEINFGRCDCHNGSTSTDITG